MKENTNKSDEIMHRFNFGENETLTWHREGLKMGCCSTLFSSLYLPRLKLEYSAQRDVHFGVVM